MRSRFCFEELWSLLGATIPSTGVLRPFFGHVGVFRNAVSHHGIRKALEGQHLKRTAYRYFGHVNSRGHGLHLRSFVVNSPCVSDFCHEIGERAACR